MPQTGTTKKLRPFTLTAVLNLSRHAVPALRGCAGLTLRHLNAVQKKGASSSSVAFSPIASMWSDQLKRLAVFLGEICCEVTEAHGSNPGILLLQTAASRLIATLMTLLPSSASPMTATALDGAAFEFRKMLIQNPAVGRLAQRLILLSKVSGSHHSWDLPLDVYIAAMLDCASFPDSEGRMMKAKFEVVTAVILNVPGIVKLPPKTLDRLLRLDLMDRFLNHAETNPKHLTASWKGTSERSFQHWRLRTFANLLVLLDRLFKKEQRSQQDNLTKAVASSESTHQSEQLGLKHITIKLLRIFTELLRRLCGCRQSRHQISDDYNPGAIKELAALQDGAFLTRLQECLGSQNYVVFLEFMSEVLRYLRINHRIYLAKDDQLSHVYATQKVATALAFGCRDFQTRAWSLQLFVSDDIAFYQGPLGPPRAMVTALNSLLYSESCNPSPKGDEEVHVDSDLPIFVTSLLMSLQERDNRRSFCPPSLWVAPYLARDSSDTGFDRMPCVSARVTSTATRPRNYSPVNKFDRLLSEAPQCIPFQERLGFFRSLLPSFDQRPGEMASSEAILIRRSHVLEDGFAVFASHAELLRSRFSVTFIDAFGMPEAGADGGGLQREFLEESPDLMSTTPDGLAYPHAAAATHPQGEGMFEFLGMILARMLMQGMLIDFPLASFFIARLQGRLPFFDELAVLDAELHKNLVAVKNYEGDVAELGLTFSVDDDTLGKVVTVPLMENGAEVPVTNDDKLLYVHLLTDWHLIRRLNKASAAFARGLNRMIPAEWLKWFSPSELNALLTGGEAQGVDPAELARHTMYTGGYTAESSTVKLFWKVFRSLSTNDCKALFKFVTARSRAPLGGFQFLKPPFTIRLVPCEASVLAVIGGKDVQRLPTASTCFNMLKLPNYRRESTMRKMILAAIHSNAGFDLS